MSISESEAPDIGGFLGLERPCTSEKDFSCAVNSGRSGLEMILRHYRPKKLLLPNGGALKKILIERKIFVPTYWPDASGVNTSERLFVNDMIHFPVDQRYNFAEIAVFSKYLHE